MMNVIGLSPWKPNRITVRNYLSVPTESLFITRGRPNVHCRAIKRSLSKKRRVKARVLHCSLGSYKSTYMYSDWSNNFWIVQSHLPVSPIPFFQSTISQYKTKMSQFVYTHTTPAVMGRGGGGEEERGAFDSWDLGHLFRGL
jgi:hypothetical protein